MPYLTPRSARRADDVPQPCFFVSIEMSRGVEYPRHAFYDQAEMITYMTGQHLRELVAPGLIEVAETIMLDELKGSWQVGETRSFEIRYKLRESPTGYSVSLVPTNQVLTAYLRLIDANEELGIS